VAEYHAEWLVRGLSIVPYGSKWPQHKKATIKWRLGDCAGQLKKNVARQLTDRAGQKKNGGAAIRVLRRPKEKLRHSNQWIAPAKRTIAARQMMDCAGQKNKIAAWQSGYCASLLKNCGKAIEASRRPLEKLRRINWGIALAS
jgi:hypothetical protein